MEKLNYNTIHAISQIHLKIKRILNIVSQVSFAFSK